MAFGSIAAAVVPVVVDMIARYACGEDLGAGGYLVGVLVAEE